MMNNFSTRKSIEAYVQQRIKEIPSDINQAFPNIQQIWKCENQIDFLYGYYVGKIEEGILHYLLKSTRKPIGGFSDLFEIRGILETYRMDLKNSIDYALSH